MPVPGRDAGVGFVDEANARGWTGSSPGQPFGNLAATDRAVRTAQGPWLCVPVFRRVCPFEDERRCAPGATQRLAPETITITDRPVCCTTLERVLQPGKCRGLS